MAASSPAAAGPGQRWAEVDLDAVRHNVGVVLAGLPPGTRLFAAVKAGAYGHGALAVARATLEAGAWGLAVSTPAEAVELRGLVEPERVLAMGGLAPGDAAEAVAAGCALTCHGDELAAALEAAAPAGGRVAVHLKVDTGMGRLGCSPEQAPLLARRIAASGRLRLAGTYTHFASAGDDAEFTRMQFGRLIRTFESFDTDPGLRHACNSAAALLHPEMALDAVRCGIALYGYGPPGLGLRPALALRSVVTQVKDLPPGQSVGYGSTWTAPRLSRVATVAIGYADGVMRARSNRGEVVVRGRRVPLIGRVSMDQVTIDVTELPETCPGDPVEVVGPSVGADEVGEWSGTIAYEVLTAIGPRVARRYLGTNGPG